MIFGSVCSGIEAASVAWEPLGWRAAFVSEIEPFPRAVLAYRQGAWDARHAPGMGHNGGPALWGDFTTIRPRHLRRLGINHAIDLLVGGTPCQSFSIAGLRGGLDDARGNLALEYLRLARRLRPRWLVWENVPGVLSSNGGRDFGAIIGGMVQLGYGICWRVLDAQYFGVPQRRRRVFVVGYLGDWRRAAAVLLEPQGLRGDPAPRRKAREGASGTLAGGARRNGGYSTDDMPLTCGALDSMSGGADENDAEQGRIVACIDASFGRLQGCSGQDANHGHSHLVAFGGAMCSGDIKVSPALNAHGGASGRLDFETEAFVVAPPLTGNPYGDHESREGLLVSHTLTAKGFDASEDGTGRGIPLVPVAFDCMAGGNSGLAIGDIAGALHGGASGGRAAVAWSIMPQNSGKDFKAREVDISQPLMAGGPVGGNQGGDYLQDPGGVRRLTPTECERLQSFPDGYTRIPVRKVRRPRVTAKRPADMWECIDGEWFQMAADGPRYGALGNSMNVEVMRWIGRRIAAVDAIPQGADGVQ